MDAFDITIEADRDKLWNHFKLPGTVAFVGEQTTKAKELGLTCNDSHLLSRLDLGARCEERVRAPMHARGKPACGPWSYGREESLRRAPE